MYILSIVNWYIRTDIILHFYSAKLPENRILPIFGLCQLVLINNTQVPVTKSLKTVFTNHYIIIPFFPIWTYSISVE